MHTFSDLNINRFHNDTWQASTICLPCEHFLEAAVYQGNDPSGDTVLSFVCTPADLKELVVGNLHTEGIVSCFADILDMEFSEDMGRVRVRLTEPDGLKLKKKPLSGEPKKEFSWDPEWIYRMSDLLGSGMELYENTISTHSAILMRDGEVICKMEDIGRHNAFDKACGYALINGVDLEECLLFSSGRQPRDMVRKAVNCRIGAVASKSLPTAEGAKLARENGITIIHLSKRRGFITFPTK